MELTSLKNRLLEKERELLADMARTETEARSTLEPQDRMLAAENKETLFRESTSDWNTFTQVRDALQRMETGAFGKCMDCGRPIEAHRLESIPWTPYCLADQNRRDRELSEPTL
jgi:DnaK suppressor protein